jgi:hypothetical protein
MEEKLKRGSRYCKGCGKIISVGLKKCHLCNYEYPRKPRTPKALKEFKPEDD